VITSTAPTIVIAAGATTPTTSIADASTLFTPVVMAGTGSNATGGILVLLSSMLLSKYLQRSSYTPAYKEKYCACE
jgi:hypothetical protein